MESRHPCSHRGGRLQRSPSTTRTGRRHSAALATAAHSAGFVDVRAAAAAHLDFGAGEDSWKGWPHARYCRAENRASFPTPVRGQDVSRFDQLFVQRGVEVAWTGVVEEEDGLPPATTFRSSRR